MVSTTTLDANSAGPTDAAAVATVPPKRRAVRRAKEVVEEKRGPRSERQRQQEHRSDEMHETVAQVERVATRDSGERRPVRPKYESKLNGQRQKDDWEGSENQLRQHEELAKRCGANAPPHEADQRSQQKRREQRDDDQLDRRRQPIRDRLPNRLVVRLRPP